MSDQNTSEEIKDRLPIETVVGSYIPLKKAGRTYKALCPFHGEKTPSFTVTPDRGVFKCFGCGKGGDIFDFVMEIEGLTFPEAQRLLAEKAGVTLPEWKPSRQGSSPSSDIPKTRLFSLNDYVAKVWHTLLTQHEKASAAREYLTRRGLTAKTITKFQIGYAPYGSVTRATLEKAGYSQREWQQAGDPLKFQDRIVFPIQDLTGKTQGFTGRLLEHPDDPRGGSSRGPKYWNTPETPVFVKSRAVFAIHHAKHAIQKEDCAILAEGQMDVVMLHQHGYENTVASSGTALTVDQLKLIGRFSQNIIFAYDSDKAGIEATKRGIELALSQDLTPYVISIPNGKDPAECLLKEPELWRNAVQNKKRGIEWVVDQSLESAPRPLPPEIKKSAAKELVRWLGFIQDPTEQADWFSRLAAKLETNEKNIREIYSRVVPNVTAAAQREEPPNQPHEHHSASLAETAIAILLTFPETYPPLESQLQRLEPSGPLSKIVTPIFARTSADQNFETVLNKHLTDEQRKEIALTCEELLLPYGDIELSPAWAITELSLILQRIRSESREEAKLRISDEIQRAQTLGDSEAIRRLFQELQNLL